MGFGREVQSRSNSSPHRIYREIRGVIHVNEVPHVDLVISSSDSKIIANMIGSKDCEMRKSNIRTRQRKSESKYYPWHCQENDLLNLFQQCVTHFRSNVTFLFNCNSVFLRDNTIRHWLWNENRSNLGVAVKAYRLTIEHSESLPLPSHRASVAFPLSLSEDYGAYRISHSTTSSENQITAVS